MGIARMGPYRPKFDAVNRGGKVGRPKLLHNGTGRGLTGGGGLNAKGTGGGIKVNQAMKPMHRQLRKSKYQAGKYNARKINERERARQERQEKKTRTEAGPPMNRHPVGFFMYGNDQWGQINKSGQVIWKSKKPVGKSAPIIGFNQALPWLKRTPHMTKIAQEFLQNRRVAPAYYHDPIYTNELALMKLDKDTSNVELSDQEKSLRTDFDASMRDLNSDYAANVGSANTQLGASNLAGSGLADELMLSLTTALDRASADNKLRMEDSLGSLSHQREALDNSFNVNKAVQERAARERWAATHQGQKPPDYGPNKVYTQNGIQYRQNEHGVPMTWTNPKKKKPKYPNAKTYKGPNGEVRQIRRGA